MPRQYARRARSGQASTSLPRELYVIPSVLSSTFLKKEDFFATKQCGREKGASGGGSLPGPAACITALTMSGLPTRRFAFEAFLPRDKKERALVLDGLANETRTIIIYEAPHHLVKTLEELESVLGSDRKLTICRELTKRYEEKMQTTLGDSLSYYEQNEPRGEYVLVLQGKSFEEIADEEKKNWESMTLEEHMQVYESQGIARKEAMKLVAKDRGISKRDVYQALLS